MPEIIEANPADGTVKTGRVPMTDIVEPSTIKRLQDHGYVLRHVDDDDSPASLAARDSAKRSAAPSSDSGEAAAAPAAATDETIEQGVAVAEHAAPSFYNRVNEKDERKVVKALYDFFVLGKKARGVKMPKPEKEAE